MFEKRIAVVMPSFLGDYTNAAKNREEKFLRAVNSVRTQSYDNKLLVVVSDGCLDTVRLCNELKLSGGYGFLMGCFSKKSRFER